MRRIPITLPEGWRPRVPADYAGPRVALIHGLLAGTHMQRHLLSFLREHGVADTTLYGHATPSRRIADELANHAAARPLAIIGYSQGGFQARKVAAHLDRRGMQTDLLVTIGAGGLGRLHPHQWGLPRHLRAPRRVMRYLNVYSRADVLGSDLLDITNRVWGRRGGGVVENIALPRHARVGHTALARCYSPNKVHPLVRTVLLERLLAELGRLGRASR